MPESVGHRGEGSVLLFTPCLCFGNVVFGDARGEKGKLLFGLRSFSAVFPMVLKFLGQSVCESSTGFFLDHLQDVSLCGLLCLKHPSTSCCIQQHSPAALRSTPPLYFSVFFQCNFSTSNQNSHFSHSYDSLAFSTPSGA